MLNKKSKIYLAGHTGLVGSSILRKLKRSGYKNIIYKPSKQLDLKNQKKVLVFLKKHKPDFIFIAAAKVGGIYSNNKFKADFIYDNLSIQTNIIHSAYLCGVKNLIFLGSSCVYPRNCKQPIKEKYLLSGALEETNDAYAIAKIAGIKMCEAYNKQYGLDYLCLMPTNLYGPNDNYDLNTSHFYPALISKIHQAKIKKKKFLKIWGNGKPLRELLYVDDLANACEFFLKKKTRHFLINIGSGEEKTILNFAKFIMERLNVDLKIKFDKKKPNGTYKKLLDSSLARKLGWSHKTNFEKGISIVINDYLKNHLKKS